MQRQFLIISVLMFQHALLHLEQITQGQRSEEHTSELQSRGHLVCRLLLEKKNTAHGTGNHPPGSQEANPAARTMTTGSTTTLRSAGTTATALTTSSSTDPPARNGRQIHPQ